MRSSAGGDGLRRAGGHHAAAGVAALGAQIDDVVGSEDDVQVVLDQDDGVAGVHEGVKRDQEALDVGEVEAGGGLVKDVDGVLCSLEAAQLGGDLDALGLAAREGCGGLAEGEVAQPQVIEHGDLATEGGVPFGSPEGVSGARRRGGPAV